MTIIFETSSGSPSACMFTPSNMSHFYVLQTLCLICMVTPDYETSKE
jgi:hypothetical protein